jgi:hypothetical protein
VGLQGCPEWTEAMTVGGEPYLATVQAQQGYAARHRSVRAPGQGTSMLRETSARYGDENQAQKWALSPQNTLRWRLSHCG